MSEPLLQGRGDFSAPEWFEAALAQAPEAGFVTVAGARIETLSWGRKGAPGLLLAPGHGANAHWWAFIAPYFAADWRVVSFSWSGMGRSDWRDAYDTETYVAEALAVAEATGLYQSGVAPVLVGHSYGGAVAMAAAVRAGERLRGAVIIDSALRTMQDKPQPAREASRPHRVYPSLEAALERFRFLPPQPTPNLFIAHYIARESLKQVEDGWTWRFDPDLRRKRRFSDFRADLGRARCPVAFMRGARSGVVPAAEFDAIMAHFPGAPRIEIADADHHVMVDQPLAMVEALTSLLAGWP